MHNNNFFVHFTLICIFAISSLFADIRSTCNICEVYSFVQKDALVFFNIAEVCTDSSVSLGCAPWRKTIKRLAPKWPSASAIPVHDYLTLLAATEIPCKCPEEFLPSLIRLWQQKGIVVMGLTSRSRDQWYDTPIAGVDRLTEKMLRSVGIDFSKTIIPSSLKEELDPSFYSNGIIYAPGKATLIYHMLDKAGYRPARIIYVDDKLESLKEVEWAAKQLGIPFIGFWYKRTAEAHRDFDPRVAHLQLLVHYCQGTLLSDQEAKKCVESTYSNVDPDTFFLDVLDQVLLSWEPPSLKDLKP